MTGLPIQPPVRLLTIADYAALGEDDQCRWELQEGRLIMSPSPTPWHQLAGARLHTQIESQLPADLVAIPDVDVDLQLAPPDQPGSSRRPDLVVVDRAELDRVRAEGGILRASNVQLVVETLSPGSRRTDYVVKRANTPTRESIITGLSASTRLSRSPPSTSAASSAMSMTARRPTLSLL
jgi:Uma2 family endonuclease